MLVVFGSCFSRQVGNNKTTIKNYHFQYWEDLPVMLQGACWQGMPHRNELTFSFDTCNQSYTDWYRKDIFVSKVEKAIRVSSTKTLHTVFVFVYKMYIYIYICHIVSLSRLTKLLSYAGFFPSVSPVSHKVRPSSGSIDAAKSHESVTALQPNGIQWGHGEMQVDGWRKCEKKLHFGMSWYIRTIV